MEIFEQTSDLPYDRHSYSIVLKNEKVINFENWEDVSSYWFTYREVPNYLDYIVVNSKKKSKEKVKSKGFG